MTFEEYLKQEYVEGKIDFTFRAHVWEGVVKIYVHPLGKDGRTTPSVEVIGNTLDLPEDWNG